MLPFAFYHGFNHGEAIRSFQEAARLDPKCAMAHYGIALACGPHINLPLVPLPAAELAWQESKLAQENAEHASPVERDLIEALSHRYANPQPEDRAPLDLAYADAMRKVCQNHPNDPDVGAFFAEAMMDLRPWNQWTPEGQANPGTEEILATLESVLKLSPKHPFANHLFIHATEASPHPERATVAADRLRSLQPGLAHNVHMPSHIDIRCGRWQEAVETNIKAVEADRRYRKIAGPPKGLISVYVAHNRHMLAYAAMMTGQRALALKHIRAMVAELPADFLKENALQAEGFVSMPLEVMVRFGMWDEILAEPNEYPDYMPGTRAFHHAARAIAYAARGAPAKARQEQAIFLEKAKLVPKEETFGNNTAEDLFALTKRMTEGEILIRANQLEAGLAELREAIKLEDALRYDEPPGWLIPIRHSLGATFMRNGRFAEAEQVYREDLARLPGNGWSLFGLAESLTAQKKNEAEAKATRAKFQILWAKADTRITSSCFCQPAPAAGEKRLLRLVPPAATRLSRASATNDSVTTMDSEKEKKRPNEWVKVKRSRVHGTGVFAARRIPKGTRIIEYTGERISWKEAQDLPPLDPDDPHHTFFFSLDDGRVINAAVDGNEARWINHSCDPNCKTTERRSRVYIVTLRNLKKGEELFYDYSLEPADRRTKALERLFACHCGSADCRGTMLEPR